MSASAEVTMVVSGTFNGERRLTSHNKSSAHDKFDVSRLSSFGQRDMTHKWAEYLRGYPILHFARDSFQSLPIFQSLSRHFQKSCLFSRIIPTPTLLLQSYTHTNTHTHTCAQHLRNHGHVHRIVGSEPPNRYNNKIIPISLMILSSKVIFAYHDPATNSRGENLWKPRYIINQMQTYLTLSHQSYHYIMLYTWFKPITCSDIIQKPRDKVQFWRHRYQQPSDKLRSALPLMLPTMCWHEFPVKDLGFYIV